MTNYCFDFKFDSGESESSGLVDYFIDEQHTNGCFTDSIVQSVKDKL